MPSVGFKPATSAVKLARVSNIPFLKKKKLCYYSKEECTVNYFTVVDIYCNAVLSELSKYCSAIKAFGTEASPISSGCKNSDRLFCQNVWN